MSDYIIRGMAANNQVRFFAATTRDIVETARSIWFGCYRNAGG